MSAETGRLEERIENVVESNTESTFFDLSAHGVSCLYSKVVAVGARVTVVINTYTVSAEVRHVLERKDGYRVGLQFKDVPAKTQADITEAVDAYSRGVPLSCSIVSVV